MKIIPFILIIINIIFANNINDLLLKLEKKEDLSNKTKKESGGISYIIPRYNLEKMQPKNLAEILSNTLIGNSYNRYNSLDPWKTPILPFSSSLIKVFVDNVEIDSPFYNSGIILFGNINIRFIDHIEIYYLPPDFIDNNGYISIKIYSKDPSRENVNQIFASLNNLKSNSQAIEHAKKHYLFLARTFTNYKKIENFPKSSLSYNMYAKKDNFSLFAIEEKENVPIGLSLSGNSIEHKKLSYLNFSYKTKENKNNFLYSFTLENRKFYQKEEPILYFDFTNNIPVTSAYIEVKSIENLAKYYTHFSFKNSSLKTGGEIKYISFDSKTIENNINQDFNPVTKQLNLRLFFDYKSQLNSQYVFSTGGSIQKTYQDNYPDFFVKNFKIGNTFLYNTQNIFKLYYFCIQTTPANYLLSTFYGKNTPKILKSQALTFKYKKEQKHSTISLFLFKSFATNFPIYKETEVVYIDKVIITDIINIRYTNSYFLNNFTIDSFFAKYSNIPFDYTFKFTILNFHNLTNKIHLFENYIYKVQKTLSPKDINIGHLLNIGAHYHYSPNLTIGLKINNLLGKDFQNQFIRYNAITQNFLPPIKVENTQRSIEINLEYSF